MSAATWWHAVSDAPRPAAPLLVVVVADDPQAVSALPAGFGAQWRQATLAGHTATARLAGELGVHIHFADAGDLPDGHDLILLADAGRGLTTSAAQVACTHFQAEPQLVVGFGSGVPDAAWMDKVADVRSRAWEASSVPGPIAMLAGLLERAADAELPVLLDGVVSAAAAAVADRLPPAQVPAVGDEPAQRFFLDRLDLGVWAGMGIGPGLGLGSLSGLAMLNLALLTADV